MLHKRVINTREKDQKKKKNVSSKRCWIWKKEKKNCLEKVCEECMHDKMSECHQAWSSEPEQH